MRAARRRLFGAGRLGQVAGPPARVLDRARDDVLEPAEDGAAAAGWLAGAKAVLRVTSSPHQMHGSLFDGPIKVVRSRREEAIYRNPTRILSVGCGLRRGPRCQPESEPFSW